MATSAWPYESAGIQHPPSFRRSPPFRLSACRHRSSERSGFSEENRTVEHGHHLAPDHVAESTAPETSVRRCVPTTSAGSRLPVAASSLARSLRVAVRFAPVTPLSRRRCKAWRLDAAALPGPLGRGPETVVGWTPTRALCSAPKAGRSGAPVRPAPLHVARRQRFRPAVAHRPLFAPSDGTIRRPPCAHGRRHG